MKNHKHKFKSQPLKQFNSDNLFKQFRLRNA